MTEMPTAQTMWDPSPVFAILAFLVMAWKETVQVYTIKKWELMKHNTMYFVCYPFFNITDMVFYY